MAHRLRQLRLLCLIAWFASVAAPVVWGQRIRAPQFGPGTQFGATPQFGANPQLGATPQFGNNLGNAPLVPVPQLGAANGVTLGAPGFDPYATAPNAASTPPSLLGAPNAPYGSPSTPNWNVPSWNAPTSPPVAPTFPVYPNPTNPAPNGTYPGTFAPQQPPALFPNGLNWQGQPGGVAYQTGQYLRLFQDTRVRYTWLHGTDSPREMMTSDAEVASTLNLPNFFWSNRPLHVSPTFVAHFWDGPDTDPVQFPTALPSRVYSAFLNLRWQPMLTPSFGGDIDFNVGVYSDFDTFVTDSMRFHGTGVFVMALTPTVALKGGINYLDRFDVKFLPAVGLLWTPNPQTRFDIYFPKPKLAQFLTTVGNTDVWWYLNGEYGGGSWTVDRGLGGDRRVDINDIRIGGGIEWTGHRGLRGFLEAAYVFERELVFGAGPIGKRSLKDTVMIRGGLAY